MDILNRNFQRWVLMGALVLFPAFTSVGNINANNPKKKVTTTKAAANSDPQLMADKVTIKKELAIIDSMRLAEELEEEELMFPADDIYETWNTTRVNPYNTALPDSFPIDVSTFIMPFEGKVTSNYGPRRRRMHYGTDIKVQVGDTIKAAFDGKVRVKYYQRRGYGYYLVLRHPNGLETVYGHLSKFLVDSEDVVKAGEPIALGGNTGRSTGSHLHFEMRFLGVPINPAEIVDFDNFVAHEDQYVFTKTKHDPTSVAIAASKNNKYTQKNIVYHRIKKGDTLYTISKRYGVTVQQLCKLNKIKSTSTLRVGTSLRCS